MKYADRERRMRNIIIQNLPKSTKDNLQKRNKDDIKTIDKLIRYQCKWSLKVIKLIRLGGRETRTDKINLVLF